MKAALRRFLLDRRANGLDVISVGLAAFAFADHRWIAGLIIAVIGAVVSEHIAPEKESA